MLLQFGGSLIAILALAGLAVLLKLGGKPILQTEDEVARAAGVVEDGIVPKRTSISRASQAALARDSRDRIMIIKRHGNK